jgi:hypothetical protein
MKHIFIGFYGWDNPPMKQEENIYKIDDGFECWNLRKFSAEEFINEIKNKIPPINDNVLINYLNNGTELNGISEVEYKRGLWGLLLPCTDEEIGTLDEKELISLLNIFSPKFMNPAFYVTNTGITKVDKLKQIDIEPNDYQGYELFKTPEFVKFYKIMIPQMKYFIWKRDVVLSWNDEDWRLFMATDFYEGLKKYQRGKTAYTWQRESTDMSTLLETLFTAGDSQNEEIGYRLRKMPDIENEIKNLYKDRSDFVHGSYYKKIIKGMKANENDNAMPPFPDFDKLYKSKEIIRVILVAYLYLAKIIKENAEFGYNTVQNILEESIINMELREKIIKAIKPVINLLPVGLE